MPETWISHLALVIVDDSGRQEQLHFVAAAVVGWLVFSSIEI